MSELTAYAQMIIVTALIHGLLCAAFVITLVGVAIMLGAVNAAQSIARFFFVAPTAWLFAQLATAVTALIAGIGRLLTSLATFFVRHVVDPILRPIAYLIRVLIAGPPA